MQGLTLSGGLSEGQNKLLRPGTVDFDAAASVVRAFATASGSGQSGQNPGPSPGSEQAPQVKQEPQHSDHQDDQTQQPEQKPVSAEEVDAIENEIKANRLKHKTYNPDNPVQAGPESNYMHRRPPKERHGCDSPVPWKAGRSMQTRLHSTIECTFCVEDTNYNSDRVYMHHDIFVIDSYSTIYVYIQVHTTRRYTHTGHMYMHRSMYMYGHAHLPKLFLNRYCNIPPGADCPPAIAVELKRMTMANGRRSALD